MYAQSMSNTRLSNEPRSLLSRGGPALAVIGIHVAIIYGLATTMGIVNIPKFAEPIVPPAETAVPASENAIAATEASGAIAQDLKTSNRVEPTYPSASRRAGEEGTVRLRCWSTRKVAPVM